MNQLFQQLNPQSQGALSSRMNMLKQKFQQVKMLTNPIGYINSSPELKGVIDMVNQNGGNAQQLFYKLAEQKGVDPNEILNMFK